MITITAKTVDGDTTYECKISGEGADIVQEAVAIITKFPMQIAEMDPKLFRIFTKVSAKEMERMSMEIIKETEAESNGTHEN